MDNTFIRRVPWSSPPPSRPVRTERWAARTFFAFPCAFLLDVPVDMSGVIQAALRAATRAGLHPLAGGDVLATDVVHRGAILVEVEDEDHATLDADVLRLHGAELLVRELPEKTGRLRAELDELLRWSRELGHDVAAVYVRYDVQERSTARAVALYAALRGEGATEDDASIDRAG